jgi:transcription-repair coupling factor (superfamily II helicase)
MSAPAPFPDPNTPSQRLSLRETLRVLESALADGHRLARVVGADGALGAAIGGHLAGGRAPLVYLVPDEKLAEARVADLGFFLPHRAGSDDPLAPPRVEHLQALDSSPYAEIQPDRRTIMRRMAVLFQLAGGRAPLVLVASAAGLWRRVLRRAEFEKLCSQVRAGSRIEREELIRRLVSAGYSRVQVVEDPGSFAVRGAVLDVFPPIYRHPLRLELDGDELESVRLFDGDTQRTLRQLPGAWLHPVRETILTEGAEPRARVLAAADAAAVPSSQTRHLLEHIEAGEDFFGIESLAPVFHREMGSALEYLPPDTRFLIEDPEAVWEEVRRNFTRLRESADHRRAEHRLTLPPGEFFLDPDQARQALAGAPRLELRPLDLPGEDAVEALSIRVLADSNTSLRAELAERRRADDAATGAGTQLGQALRARLDRFIKEGMKVLLVAGNRTHAERLAGLLTALGVEPFLTPAGHTPATTIQALLEASDSGPRLTVLVGSLAHGFRLPSDRLALISEAEIFGPRAHRESRPTRSTGLGDLGEIAEGDLAVHEEHGVGRYRGLKKLDVRGVSQDFLHLEYDGGSVYVPVYRIGMVRRYVGGPGDVARLDKLGGKTWQEKRRRVSLEARKVAEQLLQLYAQRQALPGHAFPAPDLVFREFEETFPFEETRDQEAAIEAVLADMQSERPMDRLICGDVGYGKTEVALRAALLAILGGHQVAVLAPTTVLAEQHFVTFSERLRDFPVRVGSLSRFRSPKDQKATVAALGAGELDVVIGTHRLLSKDVRWKNLGLYIIDEEQRFGVTHKERLKELRSQVDVLTLTATPIPRTMQMAMSGLREISIIATPPADRLAIRTFLCHWDTALLAEAIAKEIARGGQVFFVHSRVQDMPEWRKKLQALAPTARIAVGHGQMPEAELEKVMYDFVDGRYDVLCSTTIIESGLDIPRANTMIINHAERFGLAQLYQLRGRIGRARERAFCYLVVPSEGALSSEAKQRLAALQRFTELGAGFQIATHDLEIRGAGDLLGDRQHGLVAAVGFDTYVRILEEAVAELRGQPIRHEHDPEVSVDVPAFLPDDYVPDTGQRLDLYRRLAQASDENDVRATVAELEDRYGPLPEEALLLAEVMAQKTLLRQVGALGYDLGPTRLVLSLGSEANLAPAKVMRLVQERGSRWKLTPDMRLAYTFDDREKGDRLAAARARLQDVLACK